MSKTIRVEEEVYRQLESIRDWKESFSQVITRLLKVYKTIHDISDILGPGHYLKGDKIVDARARETVNR